MSLEILKPLFQEALCPNELGFTADGYLSVCFTNTYIFAPIALLLTLWAVLDTKDLNTNGHPTETLSNKIKFLLTFGYTILIIQNGHFVFNAIGLSAALFTLVIVFILSFLDFKGVNVPQKPLEVYFFLVAAVTGYFVVYCIGTHRYDQALLSSVYLCLISSLAGSARNIIAAFEDAQNQAASKPKQN